MSDDRNEHLVVYRDRNVSPAAFGDETVALWEKGDLSYGDRVEFRCPADSDFSGRSGSEALALLGDRGGCGDAEGFIEKINALKRRLAALGFHCRISSEGEGKWKELVWLFRYLPSSATLRHRHFPVSVKPFGDAEIDDLLRASVAEEVAKRLPWHVKLWRAARALLGGLWR